MHALDSRVTLALVSQVKAIYMLMFKAALTKVLLWLQCIDSRVAQALVSQVKAINMLIFESHYN